MTDDLSSFGLTDKIAIVTGASQGIGRAIAPGFARAGAHIVLDDLVGAMRFLSRHLSDMVVGHVLMVDGGWTID